MSVFSSRLPLRFISLRSTGDIKVPIGIRHRARGKMSRKLWITTGTLGVITIFAGTGLAIADSGGDQVTPGIQRDAEQTAQSTPSAADTQSAHTTVSARTAVSPTHAVSAPSPAPAPNVVRASAPSAASPAPAAPQPARATPAPVRQAPVPAPAPVYSADSPVSAPSPVSAQSPVSAPSADSGD